MKKIGFIGAYDKANFIMYVAKLLKMLNYKILVVDTSSIQKTKYIVPAINPTKSYITSFESVDFAIGFESWEGIEKYLGIEFDSNDYEEEEQENGQEEEENTGEYDFVLIDVDSPEMLESFGIENAYKKYFITSFDMFSLKKGTSIFQNLKEPMQLTKVLFSYEATRESEEYLNYLAMGYKISWNEYAIYFQILGEDNKVFEENQRLERIKFRRLSINYKESLAYVIQDITKKESLGVIRKIMRD